MQAEGAAHGQHKPAHRRASQSGRFASDPSPEPVQQRSGDSGGELLPLGQQPGDAPCGREPAVLRLSSAVDPAAQTHPKLRREDAGVRRTAGGAGLPAEHVHRFGVIRLLHLPQAQDPQPEAAAGEQGWVFLRFQAIGQKSWRGNKLKPVFVPVSTGDGSRRPAGVVPVPCRRRTDSGHHLDFPAETEDHFQKQRQDYGPPRRDAGDPLRTGNRQRHVHLHRQQRGRKRHLLRHADRQGPAFGFGALRQPLAVRGGLQRHRAQQHARFPQVHAGFNHHPGVHGHGLHHVPGRGALLLSAAVRVEPRTRTAQEQLHRGVLLQEDRGTRRHRRIRRNAQVQHEDDMIQRSQGSRGRSINAQR